MKNYVEELKWRGMLQDMMPGTEEQLNKEMTTAYAGFDPTSDSLHIGNLVPVMLLKHLQICGHKPMALVGGATGMIGDPSGKSSERIFLSEDILTHNLACQEKQLRKFLDFDKGPNAAEIVNNYDWFKEMNFLSFLRDVGKNITISYMMAKDSVQNRLESGISFTEFSYQLVQGYDFYYLNQHKNCRLQVGGSDQWGNIVTGTELIRRKGGTESFALTCPLITKADGTKFGKSEGGNVWLDPAKTTPYKFYQYWLNASDLDASKYIRIFTLLSKGEIESLEKEHANAPHVRVLQKALAKEITVMVHSEEDYNAAVEASKILFSESTRESLEKLSEADLLAVFEGVPQMVVNSSELKEGFNIIDFLAVKTNIFDSKGEAKKMVQAGGVSINKSKIQDIAAHIGMSEMLSNKYILAQKGKKNYYLIKVQ